MIIVRKNTFNSKGSFTVEISIIFPLILLTVLTLLFTFLYMQQKAYLVSAASFAAQQGAELWRDSRRSMDDGFIGRGKNENTINYRIFDNLLLPGQTFEGSLEKENGAGGKGGYVLIMDAGKGLPGKKAALIAAALGKKIENAVLKPESTRVKLVYSGSGIRGRLTVEIRQEIKVPLGGMKKLFDGKATLSLVGTSSAAVIEPAEYIRNIDLAVELSKRLGDKLDLKGMLESIRSKVQD